MAKISDQISLNKSEGLDGIKWWSMRSKRSEALPKHSLFGTSLENVDRDQLQNVQGNYIPVGYIRPQTELYPLPDHIKSNISGKDVLESSRKEFLQQKHQLQEAEQQLKLKSQQALAFSETIHTSSETSQSKNTSHSTWLSEKDLEHSRDINIIGLNSRGSYNRDKYSKRPKQHNYSLIGDFFAKKMETNRPKISKDSVNLEAYYNGRNVVFGRRQNQLPYDPVKDLHYTNDRPERMKSVIDLPPNIRHMFGSRVVDSLLSDAEKVNKSLEKRKAMSGPPRPSKKDDVKSLPVNFEGNYESLGATTRYNVFPGLTTGHTISRTQQEFNDEVHLRRVPNPDEFRYQRDELSTWSEHNVLRERMKKAWDEAHPLGIWVEQDVLRARMQKRWKTYFENLPKATVNWDRSATRPAKVPDKLQPRTKPKPKPKFQENEQTPSKEEIVFVTPPLTPPPVEPDIVEMPSKFKRDDEFWEFFDQPLPR